jgi:hypothetical protein
MGPSRRERRIFVLAQWGQTPGEKIEVMNFMTVPSGPGIHSLTHRFPVEEAKTERKESPQRDNETAQTSSLVWLRFRASPIALVKCLRLVHVPGHLAGEEPRTQVVAAPHSQRIKKVRRTRQRPIPALFFLVRNKNRQICLHLVWSHRNFGQPGQFTLFKR